MPDDFDVALYERVRAFVAEKRREDVGRIAPETRLFHDLGVDGDCGPELLEAFAAEFGVDTSEIEWARHFGPEGLGCLLFPLGWCVRTDGPWPEPITLRDLTRAARAGRWVMPYVKRVAGPNRRRT